MNLFVVWGSMNGFISLYLTVAITFLLLLTPATRIQAQPTEASLASELELLK